MVSPKRPFKGVGEVRNLLTSIRILIKASERPFKEVGEVRNLSNSIPILIKASHNKIFVEFPLFTRIHVVL